MVLDLRRQGRNSRCGVQQPRASGVIRCAAGYADRTFEALDPTGEIWVYHRNETPLENFRRSLL